MRLMPPCIKEGVPCGKRRPACQDACPEMIEYRAKLDALKAAEKAERESCDPAYYPKWRRVRLKTPPPRSCNRRKTHE